MSLRDQTLPEYDRPPVVEVVLAIQFKEPIGYRSLDLARIARTWEEEFPIIEERSPLPMLHLWSDGLDVAWDLIDDTRTPRLWLQNAEGNQVLQLQQDRIALNWRQGSTDDAYPRYQSIRRALETAWHQLTATIGELGLGAPEPSICEAQYINHLGADQGWCSSEDTAELIAPWNGTMSDEFLPTDFSSGLMLSFSLPDQRGWLHITGLTADFVDGDRRLVLHLTSRGTPASPDIDGALDFMDLAHEWIVKGFTSVTTAEAHEQWGRTR